MNAIKTYEQFINEKSLLDIRGEVGKPPKGADLRVGKDGRLQVYYHSSNNKQKDYANKVSNEYDNVKLIDLDKNKNRL